MAEFQKVMEQYDRMCNSMGCFNCPIASANNGTDTECHLFIHRFSEKAERIIMQWAEENPIMTNRDKFKKVFGFSFDEKCAMPIIVLDWLDKEYEGDYNG